MRPRLSTAASGLLALVVSSTVMFAQPAAAPSGHWEGAIQVPGQELKIAIDLARRGEKWDGTISIPAQGLKGLPLLDIASQGDSVSFTISGVPGTPTFKGTVSKDAKSFAGEFSQGGGTLPFAVTRTGDAKFEPPPASTPIDKALEGAWEGSVNMGGATLRLVLKLSSGPDGRGKAVIVSVDQGGAEVPVAAVIQAGSHLTLAVPAVLGSYEGDLKDGQLTGTWTQGPTSVPLTFKRQGLP